MILEVPYYSQIQEGLEENAEKKWCGIACVAMVLGYYLKENAPKFEELLEKYGQKIEDGGFAHKDFIQIARDFGLRGFRKSWWAEPGVQTLISNFRNEGETDEEIANWMQTNIDESIFMLEQTVQKEVPVILTVTKDFRSSETRKRINHLVVLVGVEDDDFIIHDPLTKGENFKIPKEEFKKYWLRQAIIIYPD